MPRPVSQKVRSLQTLLRQRIAHGIYQPGDAFPSTRAIAKRHQVSYQTAHRILSELVSEGLLQTRQGAGTFVAGQVKLPQGVLLLFHPRARRRGSFGAYLKGLLEGALQKEGISYRTSWTDSGLTRYPNHLPVFWEHPSEFSVPFPNAKDRYALVLNDRKTAGLEAARLDTISTDDYSGGVCAAEVLLTLEPLRNPHNKIKRAAILAARLDDTRSMERVMGFRSLITITDQRVIEAGSWDMEDGLIAAPKLLALNPSAIFCCNDRLAEGVIRYARKANIHLPPLVGFDNAPIAEELGLTTIAAPWEEMIEAAVQIIQKRLKGNRGMARRQIFAPHPVIRM